MRDVLWKAVALEQSGERAHRVDGTAAKREVTTLVRSATLGDVRLTMVERRADLGELLRTGARDLVRRPLVMPVARSIRFHVPVLSRLSRRVTILLLLVVALIVSCTAMVLV